jgi:hypothetical protein
VDEAKHTPPTSCRCKTQPAEAEALVSPLQLISSPWQIGKQAPKCCVFALLCASVSGHTEMVPDRLFHLMSKGGFTAASFCIYPTHGDVAS